MAEFVEPDQVYFVAAGSKNKPETHKEAQAIQTVRSQLLRMSRPYRYLRYSFPSPWQKF